MMTIESLSIAIQSLSNRYHGLPGSSRSRRKIHVGLQYPEVSGLLLRTAVAWRRVAARWPPHPRTIGVLTAPPLLLRDPDAGLQPLGMTAT